MSTSEFCEKLVGLEHSLLKYAYRLRLNSADAQDLVQDTFMKAISSRDKFVKDEYFKAWTFTIMRNTFINNYRHLALQKTLIDKTTDSFFINQTISSSSHFPDSTYSVIEINQRIDMLNDKFRLPFKMFIEGYKYKEIADRVNLNIGTVKSRIFLARKLLKKQLNS